MKSVKSLQKVEFATLWKYWPVLQSFSLSTSISDCFILHFSFLHLFKCGVIVWLQMTWPITVRLWYISKPGGDLSRNVSWRQLLRVWFGLVFDLKCQRISVIRLTISRQANHPFHVRGCRWSISLGQNAVGGGDKGTGLGLKACSRPDVGGGCWPLLQLFKDFYAGP